MKALRNLLAVLLVVAGPVFAEPGKEALEAYTKGYNLVVAGRYEEAIPHLTRAAELYPDYVGAFVNRATCYLKLGQYEKALADTDSCLKLSPDFPLVHRQRGLALSALKRHDEALKEAQAAVDLDPKDWENHAALGSALSDLGKYKEAIAAIDAAVRLEPRKSGGHVFIRGFARYMLNEMEAAAKDFRQVPDLMGWKDPTSAYGALFGYFTLLRTGHAKEAQELLKAAGKNVSREAWPGPVIACLLGDMKEDDLKRLAGDPGQELEMHAYLGLARLQDGKKDAARAHFLKAKEIGKTEFFEYQVSVLELKRLDAKK